MNLIDEYILRDLIGYLNFLVTRSNDEHDNERSNDEILALYDSSTARHAYLEKVADTPDYRDWEYNKMMPVIDHGMHDDY